VTGGPAASGGVEHPTDYIRASGRIRLRSLPLETVSLLAALATVSIGLIVLVGWATGSNALRSFLPDALPMKSNAAVVFVMLGVAVAVRIAGNRRRLSQALALVVLLVASATALEYATGIDLGIDRLLATDVAQPGAPYPGRMAIGAVVALVADGFAILLLERSWRGWHPSAVLAVVAAIVGGLGIIGYSYGAPGFTSIGSSTEIAFPAALASVALSVSILAADPGNSLVQLITDRGLAGQLSRRLGPTVVLVLPVGAWLRLRLEHAGVLQEQTGSAVVIIVEVLVLGIFGFWTAVGILRLEQARAADLRQQEGVFETSDDLICAMDPEGRFTLASPSWTRILGYEPGGVLGSSMSEFVHPDDVETTRADFARQVEPGQRKTGQVNRCRTLDGTYLWFEWTSSRDAETGQTFAVGRDITERKRLEAQLSQAQRLEAVGQLAGGVAHDFNNILTAVRGYSELVREGLEDGDRRRHDIDEVIVNADRAAALTRQLLAFSRRQVLQPQVLDPAEIVEGIIPMLRRLLGEHVEFETHIASDLGCVKVDRSQMDQVIVNLAVNARDAMLNGGKLTIELGAVELGAPYAAAHPEVVPGPYVLLAVSDTGVGMDEETRGRIFEPFYTTKEPGRGTGMGLATVYGIVKQSGGSIYVYSELGHGTTFRIYLPRVTALRPDNVLEAMATPPSSSGTETILLVEDEPSVRGFARRSLEDQGYTVLEAAGGAEALSIVAAHPDPIALLVTDVIMPGMQGHQLAQRLTAARPELRTLYVSGFTENSVIHQGVPDHGAAFLAKPFTAETLSRAVRRVIDGQPV
jgi:PAS domain S-box-containing protein